MPTCGRSLNRRRGLASCTFLTSDFIEATGRIEVNRLKLKALHRFTSTASAVEDITALQNGKLGKGLKKFLSDEVKGKGKDHLIVVDTHLGGSVQVTNVER